MDTNHHLRKKSLLKNALLGACPACGKNGHLFASILKVAKRCTACQFDLSAHDAGDGPVFFAMSISGILITVFAVWLEVVFMPPLWVHFLVSLVLITLCSVAILRISTALLIHIQYRHNIDGFSDNHKEK